MGILMFFTLMISVAMFIIVMLDVFGIMPLSIQQGINVGLIGLVSSFICLMCSLLI